MKAQMRNKGVAQLFLQSLR